MEKGHIKIQNKGEIDIQALTLLGATNKRGDNSKIGYFGSGLKYAMAVLLKYKIPIAIFAGEKEIKITTVRKDFRGEKFDVIKVNGKLTSLTTEMGPDWEAWFAVREIYCNALDEKDSKLGLADKPKGKKGYTTFFIKFAPELDNLFSHWNEYFSEKRNDLICEDSMKSTRMFSGNSKKFIIYRKGIRCHISNEKCLYHYDLDWVDINESRTIKDMWDLEYHLPSKVAMCANAQVIKDIFDNYKDTYEGDMKWHYANRFNEHWLKVINGRKLVKLDISGFFIEDIAKGNCLVLPNNLVSALKDYFGNKVTVLGRSDNTDDGKDVEPTTQQAEALNDAVAFLKKVSIEIKHPIILHNFENVNTDGQAKDDKIFISPKTIDKGRRYLIATILEEETHLTTGHKDMTRGLQNYLFDRIIGLLADKINERL